jgi:hypothetical protein
VPPLSFVNADRPVQPLQQPAVGLRLQNPYPVELRGKLALSFSSESFVDDPAIQFASGGRTVDFRIPANQTDAVFSDGQPQVQFQVGTVAGALRLQGSLTAGSVDVTPTPAPAATITVAASEPLLRNVRVGTRTANEVELLITGYSTTRSLQSLAFQFAAATGARLDTQQLNADIESAFSAWYQSTASREFGGQFTAAIRFTISGDINSIQSVTVTATNSRGASAPSTVQLR